MKNNYEERIINVLITSSGRKIPMIDCLERNANEISSKINVLSGDSALLTISNLIGRKTIHLPESKEENLKEFLQIIENRRIDFIIPSKDEELIFFSSNSEVFKERKCHVLISKLRTIEICNDKLQFHEFLEKRGYPSVKVFTSLINIENVRLVVKERFGSGGKNMMLDVSKNEIVNNIQNFRFPLVQEYCTAKEFSVDVFRFRNGKINQLSRFREEIVDGESQITSVFYNSKLRDLIENIVTDLEILGPAVIQGFMLNESNFVINECNARFGGGSTLMYSVYSNFLDSLVKNFEGSHVELKLDPNVSRKRMVRYKKDKYLDFNF